MFVTLPAQYVPSEREVKLSHRVLPAATPGIHLCKWSHAPAQHDRRAAMHTPCVLSSEQPLLRCVGSVSLQLARPVTRRKTLPVRILQVKLSDAPRVVIFLFRVAVAHGSRILNRYVPSS